MTIQSANMHHYLCKTISIGSLPLLLFEEYVFLLHFNNWIIDLSDNAFIL